MNVYDEYLGKESFFRLDKILMIYRSKHNVLCTLNEVEEDGEKFEIKPGIPINGGMLKEVCEELQGAGKKKESLLEWKNPRILADGGKSLLWYSPAVKREIFFSCEKKKLMQISGKVFPFPPLLFYARKGVLNVFCLKTSRRPTLETVLWVAPFWNVNESGRVCLPIDTREKMFSVEEWENLFYNSAFSHAWGGSFKDGATVETIFPLLVKKGYSFPLNLLRKSKITIKNIMEGKVK